MTNLKNKIALVTGASRGIGAGIALRLAQEGAEVIVHYGRGKDEAEKTVAQIMAAGGKAIAIQADLATPDGPTILFSRINHPCIDILVNNAGVAAAKPIEEMDAATFEKLSTVNMRSVFFVTQHALSRMPDGGRIINISSFVTRSANIPAFVVYAATKGFIDVFTRHLAAELGPRNITVNAIAPGAIETQLTSDWLHQGDGLDMVKKIQALSGVGQPSHVAGVTAFLVGPDGNWTTGQVIDASGGSML